MHSLSGDCLKNILKIISNPRHYKAGIFTTLQYVRIEIMNIVTVIPLSRGIQKEQLTYFTSHEIPTGTLVTVPVRKKIIDALVIECSRASISKSDVKSASFSLKKIDSVKGPSFLSHEFMATCEILKDYFATHTGVIIDALVPVSAFNNYEGGKLHNTKQVAKTLHHTEKLIFQTSFQDRIDAYKILIRESFAKQQSIFLCFPTKHELQAFREALKKGLEDYMVSIHNDLKKKELAHAEERIKHEPHPLVILGTANYLYTDRHDIGTIIVERESSNVYKMMTRPYIDMRIFAELFAREKGIRLILADTLLRFETLKRYEDKEFTEFMPVSWHVLASEKITVVDTAQEEGVKKFLMFTPETISELRDSQKKGEHIFLFTLRKGLAPTTTCRDCGTQALCPNCNGALVLYERNGSRTFACNKCRHTVDAHLRCATCDSWNLTPLGIGTDSVHEEISKIFPGVPVFKIDKESTPTKSKAQGVIHEFYKTPGAILIGTELALSYIDKPFEKVVVVSFDSLFALPSFRVSEKIFHLLIALQNISSHKLIIQTRKTGDRLVRFFRSGNILQLYREEMSDRNTLKYPPYMTLIKITCQVPDHLLEPVTTKLKTMFEEYRLDTYSSAIGVVRGKKILHAILRIDPAIWTKPLLNKKEGFDVDLKENLYSLPPQFQIQVEPEELN